MLPLLQYAYRVAPDRQPELQGLKRHGEAIVLAIIAITLFMTGPPNARFALSDVAHSKQYDIVIKLLCTGQRPVFVGASHGGEADSPKTHIISWGQTASRHASLSCPHVQLADGGIFASSPFCLDMSRVLTGSYAV